jgi:acyl-CoA thioesterase II
VDALTFLGLVETDDQNRWRLPVVAGIATGGSFLFGGCALGAGTCALEVATGRPTVWASAQYLSYAPVGSVVDFEVVPAVPGRQTTQARAVGRVEGQEILTVNAALGRRSFVVSGTWVTPPDVPPPEASTRRELADHHDGTILGRVETRLALGRQFEELDGTPGDGRCAIWARVPGHLEPSAATLAILGDLVPGGMGQAMGLRGGGNSLDNTIRVAKLVPTEWVLCDIRIEAIENGFGHGSALLWAEDGTLLATASQSVIMRLWPGE